MDLIAIANMSIREAQSVFQKIGYVMELLIAQMDQMNRIAFALAMNFSAAYAVTVAAVMEVLWI